MYFSVAPQNIPLAENGSMVFEVDPLDSAIVHLSMLKADGSGHRWTFARNGVMTSLEEVKASDEPDKGERGAEATGAKAAADDDDDRPAPRGRHR